MWLWRFHSCDNILQFVLRINNLKLYTIPPLCFSFSYKAPSAFALLLPPLRLAVVFFSICMAQVIITYMLQQFNV